MQDEALINARKKIDEIDKKMAQLFEERMNEVKDVAAYKASRGIPVTDASRESGMLARNAAYIKDDFVREYYAPFLLETMRVSRAYQERLIHGMKVAYCGTDGAFAAIAAEKIVPAAKKIAYKSFKAAYEAVERGDCDCAVLPMENSTTGEVGAVVDLLFFGSLFVTGVYDLPVHHNLMACRGARLCDIRRVVSHPQALSQCADYLSEHGFELSEYANTALAAKYVAEQNDPSLAAIASEETAALYGLEILQRGINENDINFTRFAVVARSTSGAGKKRSRRSVLLFTVSNEAGSLARAVSIIGAHGYNMLCLRSRPMKDLVWKYYFYVETEGDLLTSEGDALVCELREVCDTVKVLGSYDYPALLG